MGTHVYIGKDGCDITSISKDMVELFDGTLIPLELSYEVFMRRLRENPLNDHLKKPMEEAKEDIAEVIEAEAVEIATEEVREDQKESISDLLSVEDRFKKTKAEYPDRVALIRVGDFYEFFEEDAVNLTDKLELTLTGRAFSDRPSRVPMCGFPYTCFL